MPSARRNSLAAAVAAAIAGASGNALAATDQQDGLEEVVVTGSRPEFFRAHDASSASKFDVPIQEIPQSVSVLTKDFIQTANIQSMEDASRFLPGLSNLGQNGFGEPRSTFAARGTILGTGRSFKLDNYSFAFQGILDMTGIERMEFVRGPAAIAYGVVSYGGIINLISKKPERDGFHAGGELGFGSYDNYRIDADLNIPLSADGRARARLNAGYQQADSFRNGENSDVLTVVPTFEFDITDKLLLSLNGYMQDAGNVAGGTLPVFEDADGKIVLPSPGILPRDTFTGNPDLNRSDNEIRAAVLRLRYQATGSTEITASVNHSASVLGLSTAYTESYYGPVSIDPASPYYGYVYSYSQVLRHDLDVFNVELSLQHEFEAFSRAHTVFVLAGYEDWRFQDSFASVCTGGINIFDFEPTDLPGEFLTVEEVANQSGRYCLGDASYDEQKNLNLGVQGQFELSDRWNLTLGLRYDDIDVFYANSGGGYTLDQILINGEVLADYRNDELTFRGGLVYELTPEINLYGMYVDGFQPQIGKTRNGGIVGNEQGKLMEVGAKGVFLNGSLGVNAAAFKLSIEDSAIPDPANGPGDNFVIAGGEEERYGGELEVVGQISESWSIAASFAYVGGKITAAPNDPTLIGRDLELGPNRSASLFLNYTFAEGSVLDGLNLGVSYSYASEQTPSVNVDYKIPSYSLVDLRAAYPLSEKMEIGISVSNLLDEEYVLPSLSEWGVNYGEPTAWYGYVRLVW